MPEMLSSLNMYSASANAPLAVNFPDWGIYILESHHSGEFFMPETRHDFLKLIYVLEGQGQLNHKYSSSTIKANDVLVLPPGCEHQLKDAEKTPLALIVLCIEPRVLNSWDELPELLKQVNIQQPVGDEVRKLLRQLFFEQSLLKPQSALMMTGLCFQLIASLSRFDSVDGSGPGAFDAKTMASVRVKNYVDYLQTHFYIDESLGDVAERLGVSRRYFSLLFKEHAGESWLTHLRKLRIEYAKKLLLSTDRSVTTITFESGFNDLSNFYRCFKKLEGTSPEKWRQEHRQP